MQMNDAINKLIPLRARMAEPRSWLVFIACATRTVHYQLLKWDMPHAIAGAAILQAVKSQKLIWGSGTRRWKLRVPDLQMGYNQGWF